MIEAVFAGLLGLLLGSFLNVCIHRWPRDLSVVRPQSTCPFCRHRILWFDNIPLASYLALGGRCRHCRTRIFWRYPFVEALIGLFFAAAVWRWGLSPLAARFAVFSFLLIGMIFTDLETRLLPDQFTKGGIVAGILLAAFVPVRGALAVFLSPYLDSRWISVLEAATAAVLLSGVLWLIGVIYQKVRHREGLGFGDVKMVAMIGAFLGIVGALWTMLLGSVSGTAIGLAYMWWKKHDLSHYELPFGTFLGAAALLIAWWT